MSGVASRVCATLVHMYVGRRTLNASFERTTGVSRVTRPPHESADDDAEENHLERGGGARGGDAGVNPTPSARSRAKASTTGASAGTAGAIADQHAAHAPGKHQRIAETASAKAACPPAPRRESGVAPGRFARMRAMSPGRRARGRRPGRWARPRRAVRVHAARAKLEGELRGELAGRGGASSSPNTSGWTGSSSSKSPNAPGSCPRASRRRRRASDGPPVEPRPRGRPSHDIRVVHAARRASSAERTGRTRRARCARREERATRARSSRASTCGRECVPSGERRGVPRFPNTPRVRRSGRMEAR